MMLRLSKFFLACALAAPLHGIAQETAGRVLTAVGDVVVVRGTQRIPAQRGTEVRTGDQVELGAASNAQIYLTDGSTIALRPETAFRITDYAFQGVEEGQRRAFFDLIRGGMRTVTGLIGRIPRPQEYRVVTPTATVGIRGTHYKLAHTPEGTYGGVTEGRIAVTNRSGETVFGSDQFFRVADLNTRPQQLIGPPAILNDKLEGRGKTATSSGTSSTASGTASQQASTTASGTEASATVVVAQTGATGGTGDTRASSAVATATPTVVSSTTAFQPNTTATTQGPATVVQATATGTVFYRLQGPFNISGQEVRANGTIGNFTLVNGDITLGVNLSLQIASMSVNVRASDGGVVNFGNPFGPGSTGMPLTISGGVISFDSTFKRADFPNNQGAFRCSDCGPGNSPGFADSINYKGTISGSVANITVTVSDSGGTGSASAVLSQQTPPNNDVAAMVTPRLAGGADARSAAFWAVTLDASRRPVAFGPTEGQIRANLGSATNTIVGSAPTAGNLVWGAWTGAGAQITDFNYANFSTLSGAFVPWITGDATNTLPTSLGQVTFTPVGSYLGSNSVLNSGTLTADFVGRAMTVSLNATNKSSNNTFQMVGGSSFSSISGRFSAGFTSVNCSGPCAGGTPSGSFGGFFAGPNAEGAGVAFSAGFGVGTGVSGVVGFKR